jgi:protein phosphatase
MRRASVQITSYALSHRGLVRQNNEDRVRVCSLEAVKGKQALLAVLADGVGGHQAGEVAARIAVDTIQAFVAEAHPAPNPQTALENAILAANQAILDDVARNQERKGMGTTCVCALIIGRTLYAAHLGDSRLYLLRGRKLVPLTKDHTLLEELQHLVGRNPDKANRSHPMAHVLSRYLGSPRPIQVDRKIAGFENKNGTLSLRSGDIVLLCSDGITDLVSDEEIGKILTSCQGRKRAQNLVYRALENGGHDNASAIVLQIP